MTPVADANGCRPPGSQMAPKVFASMHQMELGKPYALPTLIGRGIQPQGKETAQRVEERDRKRMPTL